MLYRFVEFAMRRYVQFDKNFNWTTYPIFYLSNIFKCIYDFIFSWQERVYRIIVCKTMTETVGRLRDYSAV